MNLKSWFKEIQGKKIDGSLEYQEVLDFIEVCKKMNPNIPDFVDGSKAIHITIAYVSVLEEQ